jgi:hypothetical protein
MSALSDLTQRLPRWFWPAVAALAGLVFGLLIGWVWWPVQWTSATLSELSPSARAVYVSAVADAYVADGSPTALQTVQTRLAPLGNQVDKALLDAIAWYQAQPNPDVVRINNLALLAGEQGAPVSAASLAAGAAPPVGPAVAPPPLGAEAAAPLEGAPLDAASATEEPAGRSNLWLTFFGLIAAAGLIGGGVYLFRRATSDDLPEGRFSPVPLPAAAPPERTPSAAPARPATPGKGATPTTAWSTTVVTPAAGAPVAPGDSLDFEDDDLDDDFDDEEYEDDDFVDDEFEEEDDLVAAQPTAFADARLSMGPSTQVETAEELTNARLTPRYGAQQVAAKSTAPSTATSANRAASAAALAVASAGRAAPAAVPTKAAAPAQAAPSPLSRLASALTLRSAPAPAPAKDAGNAPAPVAPPQKAAPQAKPAPQSKPAAGRTLVASHSCHYVAGVPGYIEALNISDPRTGSYIGEFGMGVSLRNAALHSNPDQVIALEVWLTDNQDAANYNNQARVLLSDFAAGKDYAQPLLKDREGTVRTMMTRPGGRFTLEGQNLVLEAEIQDVQSDAQGIFQSVRVATSVYRK